MPKHASTLAAVRSFTLRRLLLTIALAAGAVGTAAAVDGSREPNPPGLDALLLRIKAEYPDARILKVELMQEDAAGESAPVYRVKLFSPDGRIRRLTFDVHTLAPRRGRSR
jgi:hypothetical protein